MSFMEPAAGSRPRTTPEQQARIREIAGAVARAASVLLKQRRTHLPRADLEALGMLAVWRRLGAYDPALGTFERWAFYRAFQAMLDVCRQERKETELEVQLRRGALGYSTLEDSPAERDFHNDTPETDLARGQRRLQRIAVAAWVQPVVERGQEPAPIERWIAAAEALRIVHEEIARLSDEQRTHLDLRYWSETEVEDVAAALGVSVRTLRRRWADTRGVLEARLRARGIFGVPEGLGEAADARAWRGDRQR